MLHSLFLSHAETSWKMASNWASSDGFHGVNACMLFIDHILLLLRSCCSYFALSVKDFVIGKDILIGIWMAHGYNSVLDVGESIEDNALTQVSTLYDLLQRCFFQDM